MKTIERRSDCPISYSLDILGDRWVFLILRDMVFGGKNSFLEFRASDEKISTAVLTEKLNLLVSEDIIVKVTSPKNASKFIYLLTDKGIELTPLLVEYLQWGSKHNPDGGPDELLKQIRRNKSKFLASLDEKLRDQRRQYLPEPGN